MDELLRLAPGGLGVAIVWGIVTALRMWLGRDKLRADGTVTEADAAERLQRVSAQIAEDARQEITAVRQWAQAQVDRASHDVEQARRDASESRTSASQAWAAAQTIQRDMLDISTAWRHVITEVRSPSRSWARLEELIGPDGGPPGALNGLSRIPRK